MLVMPLVGVQLNAPAKVIYAAAADMVVIMDKGQVKWVGSPATYAASVRQVRVDTIVMETRQPYSKKTQPGGQRARLALARAVYHGSDLVLLDDALSVVDAQVIYVAAAHMVVIMDKGQVKWVGSPATYAAFVRQVLQAGFTAPTPIQAQSWPIALQSILKNFFLFVAVAKTGSEKTMAYLIPGFRMLKVTCNNPKMGPTVLVLSPTRELATQIQDEAVKFGKSSKISCTLLDGISNAWVWVGGADKQYHGRKLLLA
ncbi:ATP-dependent RNA helicase-like protein DB10 isoform X2 [Tanacetum coccineum]